MRNDTINMVNKPYPTFLLILLTAITCLSPTQTALALSAEQNFAEGNRLFREDLYWAALLRYRQAADAGLDTPLLHYNMGNAHYRAGQHDRARTAFEQALVDPVFGFKDYRPIQSWLERLRAWRR
ncbi:MAG: tetratricopeptide repeat protein [Woeseiaceae bacterium]|nr:tetratricopeptide repeat protein [Woeseiaceae bacterium]